MPTADEFLDAPDSPGGSFFDGVRSTIAPLRGRITSTIGGRHNVGSAHYSGGAVDVGMGRETPEQQEQIKASLEAAGYAVRDERTRPKGQAVWTGPHLHVTPGRGRPSPSVVGTLLGGEGGGGGAGGHSADDFLDEAPAPDITQAFRQQRADREIAARPVPARAPALPPLPAAPMQSGNGNIPLRPEDREVGAIYTDKRGVPRRWLGDSWAAGDSARETTIAETLGGAGIDLVQGLTRAPEALLDLVGWLTGGESLLTQEGKQAFEESRQFYEQFKPEAYRAEQAVPVVQRDAAGGIEGINLPSGESVIGTIAQSLPQIPQMVYGGAGLKNVAQGVLPNAQRLASVLGYGTANAGMVAPGIAEQARTEALAGGATPEEAQGVANKAMAMAAPLTVLTGGLGEGLAGAQGANARSLLSAMLRGAATEAPAEAVEEAGTSAIGDIAQGRDVNAANALESGIMAAFGGGLPGAAVAGTEYMGNRNRPADLPADPVNIADIIQQAQAILPAVAAESQASPRQDAAPSAPPTTPQTEQQAPQEVQAQPEPAGDAGAAAPDMAAATRSIDDRLAALDEAAAAQIPESEVSALNAERQELDDLVREQDRARREGIVQPLEARLSPEERATADARRQEIAATLERHRAARSAADQAQRLRSRLEAADTDAALYDVAREINPTLGTPQAQAFRATPAPEQASGTAPGPRAVPAAPGPDTVPGPSAPATPSVSAPVDLGTGQNAPNVAERTAYTERNVGELQRAPAASAPPAAPRRNTERLDIRAIAEKNTARDGLDAAKAADEIVAAVSGRLSRGDQVTLYADGKPVRITSVDRGMMQDASGQRWGTMGLLTEKGDANRIEFTSTSEAPPTAPEVAPEASEAPRAEAQRQPAAEPMPGQTSLKNAVTDAERIAEGRDPIIRKMRRANPKAVDEAVEALRETPSLGREVAERLSNGGPATPQDKAALLVHKVNLRKRRDAAAERAQAPNVSEEAKAEATREYNDLVQQIDTVDQAARFSASDAGWMLQFQKVMIAEDYSLPALERKLRMVVNRDLKPAERAELSEMAEKVATLQRKLDAVESQQASAQVAEMLARLMKQAPGRGATLAQRRTAAAESKAALSAMAQAGSRQQSIAPASGQSGQARAAIAERLGRGVVARLERAGVLEFDDRSGGTWDGTRIGIGNVAPENALGVLLHEVSHANMLDVMGEQGYERALRDLDKLEAGGDMLALRAKRRAAKSGETGQRLDDERIAYMVEEATNAQKRGVTMSEKAADFLRSVISAFRRWAATSPVFRALERVGVNRPTLRPDDFVAFARRGLDRMVSESRDTVSAGLRKKVSGLERDLRTSYLTGLPNRRKFDEDAALGWPTVAFFDVDTFKKLNDAVGHDTADVVLKAIGDEVSKLASDTVRPYHASGDEFLFRFKSAEDARPVMGALQQALEDVVVELEATTADGESKFYEYQGIGISYGVGKNYDQADADAKRQKDARLAAGIREEPRTDGPSRRLRESPARPGGRRAGDPQAVGAQRSIPEDGREMSIRDWKAAAREFVKYSRVKAPVYHATAASFDQFDTSKSDLGAHFGTLDQANQIADSRLAGRGDVGPSLMQVYLNIENPLRLKDEGSFHAWSIAAQLQRKGIIDKSTAKRWIDEGWRQNAKNNAEARDAIKAAGYDGVVYKNTHEAAGDSYIAFDPTQIKSATANRGTFDPADPNIMRSIPQGEPDAGAPVPAGADPVAFFHLAQLGAFHYADGAQDIGEWTRRMEADLGAAAGRFRSMLPDAFKASKAQASRPVRGQESVAEAVEAIGDQRRPRDIKRVVRAVVAEGMRGEAQVFEAAADALDMDEADVRALFVQPEPGPKTLSEAQAEITRLRNELRAAQRPDPEARYQNQRARDFQRRIAELEERIAAGDFAKRERVERELRTENQRLQFELEKAKERFHRYAIAAEFAQRTPLGKLWGETVAGVNFSRAIMTALDLSAVFRQGGLIVFGHPVRGAKAIPTMFKALVSERADFEAREEIMARENAPLYRRAGLQFTGIGGDALTRVEETFASRWIDKLASFEDIKIDLNTGKMFRAGAKVPFAILGGGVRGSGRAYTAFLNRLRADSFDAMLNSFARDPKNATKEEIQAIGKFINVATGRGDFFGKQPGELLTAAFFAPRLVASRFQLLAAPVTGFSSFGGSMRTQKLIAKEYARFLIGVSVFITLASMMRDEDDETKLIELDPRSSAFGKVRIGDTFIDPLGGLAQVTVFTYRVLTGETRGDVSAEQAKMMAEQGIPRERRDRGLAPLRDSGRLTDYVPSAGDGQRLYNVQRNKRDVADVIWDFTRSKFSPVVGWGFNVATGKDYMNQPITPTQATAQLVVPMSAGSVIDIMEAHGMQRGTAINLFNILGAASQYRKSKAEKAAEQENGIPGMLGVGRAPEAADGE